MSTSTREIVLSEIEQYLSQRGVSATAFGREALGDHRFVFRLRSGAGITDRTIDRVRAFMAEDAQEAVD